MSKYTRASDSAWSARGWLAWLIVADIGLTVLLRHHLHLTGWLIMLGSIVVLMLARQAATGFHDRMLGMDEWRYNMSGFGNRRVSAARIRHIRRSRS